MLYMPGLVSGLADADHDSPFPPVPTRPRKKKMARPGTAPSRFSANGPAASLFNDPSATPSLFSANPAPSLADTLVNGSASVLNGRAGSVKRQGTRQKENMFALKHGARHHAFDSEKAPYPMSYDRHVLEL